MSAAIAAERPGARRLPAEELAHHLSTYPGNDGRVFSAPEGGPLRLDNWRPRHWYPAVDATVGRPMRPHDLRHTHAALLIAAGDDPYVISQRLGHASIKITYDVYCHLFEGRDRQAADRLAEARERSGVDALWTREDAEVIELRNGKPESQAT